MGRQRAPLSGSSTPKVTTAAKILLITNVHLAYPDPSFAGKLWSVECREGNVVRVTPYIEGEYNPISFSRYEIDARGGILLPSCVPSNWSLMGNNLPDKTQFVSLSHSS